MTLEDTAHQLFSTIPEVLAGVVALIGAFFLFRIGAVQRRVESLGEHVLEATGMTGATLDVARTAFSEHRRHAIKQEIAKLRTVIGDDHQARFERAWGRLDAMLRYRRKLVKAASLAMWLSVSGMLVNVGLLMFTQALLGRGDAVVYGAMAVGVACLVAVAVANTRMLYMLLQTGSA